MFCSKCGYKNPDEFLFCQQCGNKLTPAPAPAAPAAAPVEPFAEQADFTPAPAAPVEPEAQTTSLFSEPLESAPTTPVTPAAPIFSEPAEPAPQSAPVYSAPVSQQAYSAPQAPAFTPAAPAAKPVFDLLRGIITSPMFIVGSVALTLSVLLGAFKNFHWFDYESKIIYQSALRNILQGTFKADGDTYTTVLKIVLGLLAVTGIIAIAGVWMTYFAGLSSKGTRIGTSGFTVLKISAVANLFLICLGLIGFEGFLIYRILVKPDEDTGYYYSLDYLKSGYISLAIGAFIIFVIAIALFVTVISSLSTVQRTAESGTPGIRVSTFASIIMFLYAGLKGYTIISYFERIISELVYSKLVDGYKTNSDELLCAIVLLVATLLSLIAYVCFAALIIRYKQAMKTARELL